MEQNETNDIIAVREVCVRNRLGLHARPAAKLAQEAQLFEADITLESDGQTVDCKSVLDILTLAAGPGCGLVLSANGEDAQKAVDRLAELLHEYLDKE